MKHPPSPLTPGKSPTNVRPKHITLCADGKYRWVSEFDMLSNPAILFLLFKVFGFSISCVGVFIMLLGLFDGDGMEAVWLGVRVTLIMCAIFFFLILLGYLLVAAIYGGKYVVMFEMDDEGILHRQFQKEVEKVKALAWISALAAIASGNPTAAGTGILVATKTSSYSSFSAVRSVKAYPRRHLIKVNEPFCKNQIYVDDDFEFVYTFICNHCPKAKCS